MPPYLPGAEPPVGGTQWHSPTRVPGYNYQDWNFTNTVHGPWTQLNFSYGNSRAMATVIVNSYAVQDGGYRQLQAQQGIDQAFLTLNFPDALGDHGTLTWNIGTFQNRYGTMGRYDGGMYETYIFGRTHITRRDADREPDQPRQGGQLAADAGARGRRQDRGHPVHQQPELPDLNAPAGHRHGQPFLADMNADYLPYAGSVPQGSTFVHHAHAIAKYQKTWTFGLHYLYTWTPDDNWHPINSAPAERRATSCRRCRGPIQGSIAVVGAEVRFSGGALGEGYAAYSHIDARNINALADSLEMIHSPERLQLQAELLRPDVRRRTPAPTRAPERNRHRRQHRPPVLVQLRRAGTLPRGLVGRRSGSGVDRRSACCRSSTARLHRSPSLAMRPTASANPALAEQWDMSTKKLKMGLDAVYTPLYWLGFNARFDWVQPDLDSAYSRTLGVSGGSDKSFEVITARLLFRTQFVTHEQIQLQYAHYWLGDAAYPPYPYEWVARADANMVGVFASMWW